MKTVFTLMILGALSFTGCAHQNSGAVEGRDKAGQSCCKDSKEKCDKESCKLKKGEKKGSCCSKE